jgi:hypothetical protein
MSFKHTNQILLSTPMGISIGIHALLAAGIIFLSWERPERKLEIPPIKIKHIKLEHKKSIKLASLFFQNMQVKY